MNLLLTIFAFLLIISFLVFIHELGHFMAARLVGVGVKEFALGFGPALFKREYKGTVYKLNLIPLGGYVQLEGEHDVNTKNGFRSKSFPAKFLILIGGVFMNSIAAIILLGIYLYSNNNVFVFQNLAQYEFTNTDQQFSFWPVLISDADEKYGWDKFQNEELNILVGINDNFFEDEINFVDDILTPNLGKEVIFNVINIKNMEIKQIEGMFGGIYDNKYLILEVDEVFKDGRAQGYLDNGDLIVGIGGTLFKSPKEFRSLLEKAQETDTTFQLLSTEDNELIDKNISIGKKDEEGLILDISNHFNYGITFEETPQTYFIKYKDNLLSPFSLTYDLSVYQFKILGDLISDAVDTGEFSELSNAVGGPVKVGAEVNNVIKYESFESFIPLTALISLSLAIFNVLPIPALDGGQITLALIEAIRRKPLPDSIVNKINLTGFLILIGLSVVIFIKDIVELV
jgi:regulator of sigma E protease